MRIVPISPKECSELLERISFGRLACSLNDQPYVVPVAFSYENDFVYVFPTLGKKVEWMRKNPKICLQVDELGNHSNWLSVVVTGAYVELAEPQYSAEREHARDLLGQNSEWYLNALAERRNKTSDLEIEPVFFRIHVTAMSGLRAIPEAE